jgi:hypothetical protein
MNAATPPTIAALAVDVAQVAGRLEGLIHALRLGSTNPAQLVDDLAAEAEKLVQLAERAAAPAPMSSRTGGPA